MATVESSLPKLGIILPDDPIDSEMHRLDRWLAERGRDDVTAATLLSTGIGGHFEADLYATGDLEVIAPVGRELVEQGCGTVIWACTSASFIGGLDWAERQAAGLADAIGVPSSSTTLAFVSALEALGVKRVHLLGAYPDPVTRAFAATLGEVGVEVDGYHALGTPDGSVSFKLQLPEEVGKFAARLPDDAAPILSPDTAINSLDLVEGLEQASGRLVLTANQVTLWHGLDLLGVPAHLPDCGDLCAA